MENPMDKQGYESGPELPARFEFENGADKTGFWFATAVLCAVLAAGVIVYRTANVNDEVQSASNQQPVPAAAQPDPIGPPPILPQR